MRKTTRAIEAGDYTTPTGGSKVPRYAGRGRAVDGFCAVCGALTNHYRCGCEGTYCHDCGTDIALIDGFVD